MVDLQIPSAYFGFITAIMQIISAISSKYQRLFHVKFKNRALTYISIPFVSSILVTGLIIFCDVKVLIYASIIVMCLLYAISKGPFYTLIRRYLNSFSTPDLSTKIYSANALVECICSVVLNLLASFILSLNSTAFALTILGGCLFIIIILVLEYMKTRLGLKPEEYKKSDIEYVEMK